VNLGWQGLPGSTLEHREFVEQRAVGLGHVERLEDVEVGRILDHPAGVARRLGEVDDYRIERAFRIELAAKAADHLLIGPDVAEGLPGRKRLLFGDFRKAADQGEATAQGSLGVMYLAGVGVPQDYVQAYLPDRTF
jgi:TPR repeat protein